MKIAVIGAGSWGTAMAHLIGQKGIDVKLWARRSEVASCINTTQHNPDYLSALTICPSVSATTNLSACVAGSDGVILATPSFAIRQTCTNLKPYLSHDTPLLVLTKGIEEGSGLTMAEVVQDVLGASCRLAVLSGPNHAEEVALARPSAAVIASYHDEVALHFQDICMRSHFRIYTSRDMVGVEICAAAKNVIAIAVGISYGLGLGENTAALIITRGLAEIARLSFVLGADPQTCMGLAGVGDMIATCMSKHSRNRMFGEAFARKMSLADYESKRHMVVEGARAAFSVTDLAHKHEVDMPLCQMVRRLLTNEITPDQAQDLLMSRSACKEFYGLR